MAVWDDVITERDRQVMAASGHSARRGLGYKPAVVVVDAQHHFVGLKADILSSIAKWATSVGEEAWTAVDQGRRVVEAARRAGVPVFYSMSGMKANEEAFDSFQAKRAGGVENTGIVAELRPARGEVVIEKRYASVFNGTPFASFLNALHIDTLLVFGFTSSGCVRATVVDAAALNYKIGVIGDACADRLTLSHKASMLDMDMKYADVISREEAVAYLASAGREVV